MEPLEVESGLMGLATSVLLGWEGFDLDNLFMVGLVLQPDLGWPEPTMGLSGLVQPLLWRAAVSLVVKILGLSSVGLMPSLMFLGMFPEQEPSRTKGILAKYPKLASVSTQTRHGANLIFFMNEQRNVKRPMHGWIIGQMCAKTSC